MRKQDAGQSETLQSLHLYFFVSSVFLFMHTTHVLLSCFLFPVGGLRSEKYLPENHLIASRVNVLAGLIGVASGELLLCTSEITFELFPF